MCRLSFQSQKSVPPEHEDLSLYKQCPFIAKQPVKACFLSIIYRGRNVYVRIVYPICCGIDVHKNLLLHVLLLLTLMVLQLTNQSTFLFSAFQYYCFRLISPILFIQTPSISNNRFFLQTLV